VAKVAIPPLVGLSEADARTLLATKGLRVTVEYIELAPGNSSDGLVISQDPSSGVEVAPNSNVLLKVGRAAPPTTTTTTTTIAP
jgi:beta-lactam-binding protein with PASTA domain